MSLGILYGHCLGLFGNPQGGEFRRPFLGIFSRPLTLTFCSDERQEVLACPRVHERVRQFISDSLSRYGVWVDSYVLMPNHVHLIISTAPESAVLGDWVKAFKAVVAHREFKWQPGFFDHVLRSEESTAEKWEYIRMNPVRAGLAKRPEDWAYSGFFDQRIGREIPPRVGTTSES